MWENFVLISKYYEQIGSSVPYKFAPCLSCDAFKVLVAGPIQLRLWDHVLLSVPLLSFRFLEQFQQSLKPQLLWTASWIVQELQKMYELIPWCYITWCSVVSCEWMKCKAPLELCYSVGLNRYCVQEACISSCLQVPQLCASSGWAFESLPPISETDLYFD